MTVREYYLAAENGVIDADEKLELLRGEVVEMSPQKSAHAAATTNVRVALQEVLSNRCIREHSPLTLDDHNEPEPDIVVANGPLSTYFERHPGPSDVVLVVEVSDTSLRKDRTLKGPLYAEFGIPEYWILDLNSSRLEVYREPAKDAAGKGSYTFATVVERGGSVAIGGGTVTVASLLPELPS